MLIKTLLPLLGLAALTATLHAKPLLGGLKTIAIEPSGNIPGSVASADMGQGGYLKGVKQAVVPLVMVAFESSAKATVTNAHDGSMTTKSLESHLLIDEKILQAIADEAQALVEKELTAQGFELLAKDTIDKEDRFTGIEKDGKTGAEIGDNFMSGFAGNGVKNRWYSAGSRPFFGTGATGALGSTSPLIRLAREKKYSLLFFRFKIQFADIDAKKGVFFSYVKGKNVLHILSADMAVFSPANTLGTMVKLKADVTAGDDYVKEVQELPKQQADEVALQMGAVLQALASMSATTASSGKHSGHYGVVADPERYKTDSLLLITGVSRQFADALKKAQ